MEFEFKCPYTKAEVEGFKEQIKSKLWDWVMEKYPKISLEMLENNIASLLEIHKYDEKCPVCLGTQQCPTEDGNRCNGLLMPDGVISIYYSPCPKGHTRPRSCAPQENERAWSKKR